ncbi:MAG: ABC transporter ATP-binding protein [Oscillospiraceae bacterium]|nr:ABC transporter ATP-binding protein [Oscillospiraceae bacterium]
MMAAIKLTNVTKKYDKKTVIDDLSFEISEHSICGFLGLNGAGKTTTFKLLNGLIDSNGGEIEILGEKISSRNQSKDIKFLQDVPEFYNYMTAYEYLKFICNLNNLTDIDKKICETLELVGLAEAVNKRIGKFSRGMKQRIGIASNIISGPKILLLDEPVSALDPMGRKEVFDLLGKLRGKMTILFSTHIIDDIEKVSDQVIIIDHGKKIIDGTVSEVKNMFLTNIVEVDFINKEDAENFSVAFKDKSACVDSNTQKNSLRFKSDDMEKLQKGIFSVLNKEKITISSFNIIAPTLEEIFIMEVVK